MNKILLPFLALFLAACSSPQVLVTPFAEMTVTSPPPTATLIPTSTLSPQFIELQEQIAASGERFTLLPNGTLVETTAEGVQTVPGLSVDKNGVMTLQGGGEQVTLSPADVSFDDEKGLRITGFNDKDSDGDWEAVVVKGYPICAPENFRDCEITVEKLFNGEYFRWLESLSKPFDQSKIKDVSFSVAGNMILYNLNTSPNFDDQSTAPFRRDVTVGIVFLEIDEVRYPYIVKPIELFDKNKPEKNKWIITVDPFGNIEYGSFSDDVMYEWGIHVWQEKMNITPILTNPISSTSHLEDPLVKQTFDNNPDMEARFERFIAGDVSALSEPGIVLLTTDGVHEKLFR